MIPTYLIAEECDRRRSAQAWWTRDHRFGRHPRADRGLGRDGVPDRRPGGAGRHLPAS